MITLRAQEKLQKKKMDEINARIGMSFSCTGEGGSGASQRSKKSNEVGVWLSGRAAA